MILHEDIKKFKVPDPVVTVGIFDGVHRGHRYILSKLREAARELKGQSVVLSFWPHPRKVLQQAREDFKLLNTLEEKIEMLDKEGLEHLVILPFDHAFSRLSSCDFIREYLVEKVGIRHFVVGYNHRFGKDREGDFDNLKKCAGRYGFGIERVPPLESPTGDMSSSGIRDLLSKGEVEVANQLLGWDYSMRGQVTGGSKLGTSLGFPTANITPEADYKLIPADGVYAVLAQLERGTYKGMLNIGTRPTVNQDPTKKTIEVHLLDFNGNIYTEPVRIGFKYRLRDEKKFRDIEALRDQLQKDRRRTLGFFQQRGKGNSG